MSIERASDSVPLIGCPDRVAGFLAVAESYVDHPPRNDPYFASFAQGTLEARQRHPEVQELLDEAIASRECPPSQAVKQVLSKMVDLHYDQFADYIPRSGVFSRTKHPSIRPGWWGKRLVAVARDPQRRAEFDKDIREHNLQATVSGRVKTVRIVADLYNGQVGDNPTVLDNGSGLNHAVKHLSRVWWFSPVRIDVDGVDEAERSEIERRINTPLMSSMSIDDLPQLALGIDKQPPTLQSIRRARSDSFYVCELLDPLERERFDALQAAEPPNVQFEVADMRTMGRLAATPRDGFDIAHGSLTFYQLTEAEREQAFESIKANLSPDGLLVVQEPAYPDPENPQRLIFRDNWFPQDEEFPFQTMVLDMRNPEDGFRTFISWTDGRMTHGRLEPLAMQKLEEADAGRERSY